MRDNMIKFKESKLLQTVLYIFVLALLSACILAIFFRPTPERYGINQYKRAMFLDTINGTAYRPFVYRALLPVTVRTIASLTPPNIHEASTAFVEDHRATIKIFETYQWETSAACTYFVAAILMWLCLMGFGHYAARLTLFTLNLDETPLRRALLAGSVLLGLPAFFSYTSYIYDPPQLFLFTFALYLLARGRMTAFLVTFVFCVFNKETAILLIPIYAVVYHQQHTRRQFIGITTALIAIFAAIKLLINHVYQANPGFSVEFHLFPDNFLLLTYGWTFTGLLTFLALLWLLLYNWNKKPRFLKIAFLLTLPILIGMTFLFGLLNEWRDYYEAYPIAFALAVDSLQRLNTLLDRPT